MSSWSLGRFHHELVRYLEQEAKRHTRNADQQEDFTIPFLVITCWAINKHVMIGRDHRVQPGILGCFDDIRMCAGTIRVRGMHMKVY